MFLLWFLVEEGEDEGEGLSPDVGKRVCREGLRAGHQERAWDERDGHTSRIWRMEKKYFLSQSSKNQMTRYRSSRAGRARGWSRKYLGTYEESERREGRRRDRPELAIGSTTADPPVDDAAKGLEGLLSAALALSTFCEGLEGVEGASVVEGTALDEKGEGAETIREGALLEDALEKGVVGGGFRDGGRGGRYGVGGIGVETRRTLEQVGE